MSSSLYRRLDTTKLETRLLKIFPSPDHNSLIESELINIFLANESGPGYYALSYVRGDPHATRLIAVTGVNIAVTANLEVALRHVRREDEPLILCVDAVCINQNDHVERSQQVSIMGSI